MSIDEESWLFLGFDDRQTDRTEQIIELIFIDNNFDKAQFFVLLTKSMPIGASNQW